MIKYALACANGHAFEAWFGSSDAYDKQARRRLVTCPECSSNEVEKQPMAPAVLSSKRRNPPAPVAGDGSGALPAPTIEILRALKKQVLENTEDVGTRFADEALSIHHGESEPRPIRGEATSEDAERLHDHGVAFGILPTLPEDRN